ncbi:MAG: ArsA-related P-loop ATPase [[Clostridium] scindens]
MEGNAKVIAVTGKGGVGKTSLAAGMVRRLTQRYPDAKILAIDADPAVGLATALDAKVKETLDDIRLEITQGVSEKLKDTQDILSEARFRLLDMMDEEKDSRLWRSGGRNHRDATVRSTPT